jgi:hypothetical protein
MDAIVIRFTTTRFDVRRERRHPIHPIPGESLLLWLAEQLRGTVAVPAPETEDWGWYVDIDWHRRAHMLGASASPDDADEPDPTTEPREWILQIVKHRSLKERVLGREKMPPDDACAAHLQRLLEAEPAFVDVQRD